MLAGNYSALCVTQIATAEQGYGTACCDFQSAGNCMFHPGLLNTFIKSSPDPMIINYLIDIGFEVETTTSVEWYAARCDCVGISTTATTPATGPGTKDADSVAVQPAVTTAVAIVFAVFFAVIIGVLAFVYVKMKKMVRALLKFVLHYL